MTLRLPKAALLVALPMLAVPAFAQSEEPAKPAPEAVEEAKEKKAKEEKAKEEKKAERKICKRIQAQAGSRRATKVCKTREEWKAFNQEQRNRAGRRN